jgi:hypothetical protein
MGLTGGDKTTVDFILHEVEFEGGLCLEGAIDFSPVCACKGVHTAAKDYIVAGINGSDIVDGVATLCCEGAAFLEALEEVLDGGWWKPVRVEKGEVGLHLFSCNHTVGGGEMVEDFDGGYRSKPSDVVKEVCDELFFNGNEDTVAEGNVDVSGGTVDGHFIGMVHCGCVDLSSSGSSRVDRKRSGVDGEGVGFAGDGEVVSRAVEEKQVTMGATPDGGVNGKRVGVEFELGIVDGLPGGAFIVGTDGGEFFVGKECFDVGNGECF